MRATIKHYLEDNPEKLERIINYFLEKNPEFLWSMLEAGPPKIAILANPDGSNIGESSNALLELTKRINEIHGRTGLAGDGADAGAVGQEAPNQDQQR